MTCITDKVQGRMEAHLILHLTSADGTLQQENLSRLTENKYHITGLWTFDNHTYCICSMSNTSADSSFAEFLKCAFKLLDNEAISVKRKEGCTCWCPRLGDMDTIQYHNIIDQIP